MNFMRVIGVVYFEILALWFVGLVIVLFSLHHYAAKIIEEIKIKRARLP